MSEVYVAWRCVHTDCSGCECPCHPVRLSPVCGADFPQHWACNRYECDCDCHTAGVWVEQ